MQDSSKVDLMLARVSQGKKAAKCGIKGRTISSNIRTGSKRWEEQQREADEILYGKKEEEMEELPTPEQLAQRFHETYERLAPSFGYNTRVKSRVPWHKVPKTNRDLMIAVSKEILRDWPSIEQTHGEEGG